MIISIENKQIILNRVVSSIVTLTTCASLLAGCGFGSDDFRGGSQADYSHVYRQEDIKLEGVDMNSVSVLTPCGEYVLLSGTRVDTSAFDMYIDEETSEEIEGDGEEFDEEISDSSEEDIIADEEGADIDDVATTDEDVATDSLEGSNSIDDLTSDDENADVDKENDDSEHAESDIIENLEESDHEYLVESSDEVLDESDGDYQEESDEEPMDESEDFSEDDYSEDEYDDSGDFFAMPSTYVVSYFKGDNIEDITTVSIDTSSDPDGTYHNISCLTLSDDGILYLLREDSLYTDTESKDEFHLVAVDGNGEELWTSDLAPSGEEYTYYSDIFYIKNIGILVYGGNLLALYSAEDGSQVKEYDLGHGNSPDAVVPLNDGTAMVSTYGDNGSKLIKLDLKTGDISEDISFPGSLWNYTPMYPGIYADLVMKSSMGIYTYNMKDKDVTYKCSFIDSELNPDYVRGVYQVADEEFLVLQESDDGGTVLTRLTKVPEELAANKKTLTLACYYLDYSVQKAIIEFNKSNPEYRISVTSYAQYDSENDYSAGITRLNTDIVSGNIPDILVVNEEMPFDSYVSKGILQPLDQYMENDPDFNKDDYLTNIIDSFKINNQVYSMVPSFSVCTVAAKTSDVGPNPGWTVEDMLRIADSKKIAHKDIFGIEERDSILTMALYMNSKSYIDWNKGKCYFDSDDFKQLLAFMKEIPEEIPDYIREEDNSAMWREGRALASLMYISSFRDYAYWLRGQFGEPVTVIGFPGQGTDGSAVVPGLQMCMSSTTDYPDVCWDFFKHFMSEDYQKAIMNDDWYFPIMKEQFYSMADASMLKPFYIDENGEKVEYESYFYIGGKEFAMEPLTQEERDQMVDFIESLDSHVDYSNDVINIISEEAAAYFSDQKSVDNVAAIIQSRVQMYVRENS